MLWLLHGGLPTGTHLKRPALVLSTWLFIPVGTIQWGSSVTYKVDVFRATLPPAFRRLPDKCPDFKWQYSYISPLSLGWLVSSQEVSAQKGLSESLPRQCRRRPPWRLTVGTPSPRHALGNGILRRAHCTWGWLLRQCHIDILKVRKQQWWPIKASPRCSSPSLYEKWESVRSGCLPATSHIQLMLEIYRDLSNWDGRCPQKSTCKQEVHLKVSSNIAVWRKGTGPQELNVI